MTNILLGTAVLIAAGTFAATTADSAAAHDVAPAVVSVQR